MLSACGCVRPWCTSVRGIVGAFRAIPGFVYPRYAIPAGIYLINNNVYYVILYFMDAATFQASAPWVLGLRRANAPCLHALTRGHGRCVPARQVVMSLKIVSTGVLMYLLLNKHLSRAQWVALGVLTVASVLAQLDKQGTGTSAARHASVMGFVIATVYCGLSGLAGVSTEALLKGKHNAPLQACNVLLYTCVSWSCAATVVEPLTFHPRLGRATLYRNIAGTASCSTFSPMQCWRRTELRASPAFSREWTA